ncbi:hypothetical protein [Nonomuraea basaltis]|uniref:hypothetical protein n=1 Tax=Nonomuraea basaltis TaxID=2495887 RepID=UPI00110C5986|nr:hypothetical protein [Nonomuraea basaltis]TMR88632.1 hypothetical protein EJK15_65185 [Nonomuraea basaltis]
MLAHFSFAVLLAMGVGLSGVTPGWQVTSVAGADSSFNDLAAVGASNAWAAGERRTKELDPRSGSPFTAPLIKHWNGTRWTAMAEPAGPPGFPLRRISLIDASSAAEVWIAGTAVAPGPRDVQAATRSVVSRWDGTRWRLMGSGRTTITDLDLAGGDAWIVGHDDRTRGVFFKRFHGGWWTSLPAPASLREISVRTATDIWGWGPSAVLRWNGTAWRPVALPRIAAPTAPSPAYGPVRLRFDAVLAARNGDVWIAAGFQQGDWSQPGTVLLRHSGGTWEQVRLPGDVVTSLSDDGTGGIHVASTRESITATPDGQDPYAYTTVSIDALRYAGGVLTRQSVTPVNTGFHWSDLVAVPGTGAALAAGFRWRPPQGAVILRYSG